jgi:hypothetical protein
MLRALLDRFAIRPFERAFDYDASYMRDVLAASPAAFLKFSLVSGMVPRHAAPLEALTAAGIVGTMREDCGPCTQIGVDKALKSGAKPAVVRAILAGDVAGMGETAALAYRFAHASLDRDLETADPLREEIARRWGETALVAIALTLTMARMYPTLKYALGHGKSCSKVVVGGESAPLRLAA